MTPDELATYYANLLIMQYRNKPKAVATIKAVAAALIAGNLNLAMREAFDLETAVGPQLDIIGQYVGASRRVVVSGLGGLKYFTMPGYNDTPVADSGFASYDDAAPPENFWLSYIDSNSDSYVMDDGVFRRFIKYLIALHKSDHSLKDLDDLLLASFGEYLTLTDNGDMTITYAHDAGDPDILFTIINGLGLLPHPAGVEVIVTEA